MGMDCIRASENAREEFTKAYWKYVDAIFRHCYVRVRDRETANDLTQDAFIRAWEFIARGNDVDNIRAFLYTIAGNLAINELNKRKRRKTDSLEELQEAGFDVGAEDDRQEREQVAEERRALARLHEIPSPYREALILRYVDGLSPTEIAAITGETPNVISVRLHRGKQYLRTLLSS